MSFEPKRFRRDSSKNKKKTKKTGFTTLLCKIYSFINDIP